MKTAVFLMNLGGPRNLAEVEPYLYELFADPLVVSAPFGPFRPLIARLICSTEEAVRVTLAVCCVFP